MSISVPSISVPSSKKDLWLNLNSDKSMISWYNSIYDCRRSKKKAELKNQTNKKKRLIANQEIIGKEHNGWRQTFFDFCEKNFHSDDKILDKEDHCFFKMFIKK